MQHELPNAQSTPSVSSRSEECISCRPCEVIASYDEEFDQTTSLEDLAEMKLYRINSALTRMNVTLQG